MRTSIPSILFLGLIGVTGCSAKPEELEARKVVINLIAQRSNGLIALMSFKKTNAQDLSEFGPPQHLVEYEAEIRFVEACWWGSIDMIAEVSEGSKYEAQPIRPGSLLGFAGGTRMAEGQRVKVTGKIRFEKTERGWRGPDGVLY